MMILNFLRASCQRFLKLSQFGAEGSRGTGARQARRDACAGLRDEAFLHGQLRDRRSVLLIITSVRLLSTRPSSLKKLSASVAVKSLSFVAPILG